MLNFVYVCVCARARGNTVSSEYLNINISVSWREPGQCIRVIDSLELHKVQRHNVLQFPGRISKIYTILYYKQIIYYIRKPPMNGDYVFRSNQTIRILCPEINGARDARPFMNVSRE